MIWWVGGAWTDGGWDPTKSTNRRERLLNSKYCQLNSEILWYVCLKVDSAN